MYDFSSNLLENEEILYQGRPVPGKGSKSIGGLIFVICFSLVTQIILIWSVITKTGDGFDMGFIVIFLAAAVFEYVGISGIYYNLVKKKKEVADDFYCLTNMRAMKYEEKENKLVFGYLSHYDDIRCDNVKDNFGDVYMGIIIKEEKNDDLQKLSSIKDLMTNPDPLNMPFITFESIENPYRVMNLVQDAKRTINNKQQNINNISSQQ